ncbi:MAG: PadR family transcriptional regulator [Candidatus Hadarchaeum sp.]|uniref:PadR family transcriptional regulator n=1 Tax=Candidatus Hadarchaeum sp. TaxID=2883567 RepID=UPI003D0E697F
MEGAPGLMPSPVRGELEYLVLALLMKQPMCGTDIIRTIHEKFGLLLSPGTVYPLLHELKRRGLVEFERGGKIKRYRTAEGMEEKIRGLLEGYISAKRMVLDFLESSG